MKLEFEDGSFLAIDSENDDNQVLTISMCGIKERKAIMVSSRLSLTDVEQMIVFLQEWQKNIKD